MLLMTTTGDVKAKQKISSTQGGLAGRLDDFARFGSSVASLGDLNGDGVLDLAVGSMGDHGEEGDSRVDRGAVYVRRCGELRACGRMITVMHVAGGGAKADGCGAFARAC